MTYNFKLLTINELLKLIQNGKVNLNPPYQRNFIWTLNDQRELIDTITKNWPLPNFFIYESEIGKYEMVDGQQRTKSIIKFVNGEFSLINKLNYQNYTNEEKLKFLEYNIPVVFISNIISDEEVRKFYVAINKKGKHLNIAEVQRSEYLHTNFMKLCERILDDQNMINLDIFSESSSKRLNDRDFIQELIGLVYLGIKDKKGFINDIFEIDITEDESKIIYSEFSRILNIINDFNSKFKLNNTRYKQRNDFYTLFSFLLKHNDKTIDLYMSQYDVLVFLDGQDNNGRQLIRPTNDDCTILKKYALNCVTQSNSKFARESRLQFFETILLQKNEIELSSEYIELLNYLERIFTNIELINVEGYSLIMTNKF